MYMCMKYKRMIYNRRSVVSTCASLHVTDRKVTKTKLFGSGKSDVKAFYPRTRRQTQYASILRSKDPSILVAIGPAGTAKTLGAVMVGLEKLSAGEVDRLVLTRPAVSADEELGFMPGNLEEKMSVWLLPIMDALRVHLTPAEITRLMSPVSSGGSGLVEVCSLAHMRGRTFRNSYVIVDECQNTTPSQMLMLLTRIGEGSKFVFTGDPLQHDRKTSHQSGLVDFISRWKLGMGSISDDSESGEEEGGKRNYITENTGDSDTTRTMDERRNTAEQSLALFEFHNKDVQRHPTIPFILELYKE